LTQGYSFTSVRCRSPTATRSRSDRSRTVAAIGERRCALLESVLGATPREFESRILRHADLGRRAWVTFARWTFGDGTLVTAPVVSGGVVYVGSGSGTVYGVSASSGAKVWSGTAGSVIAGTEESHSGVLIGMSIGGGLLVVPAGNALTAFAG
jgi:hypothetical protein